MRCAAVFYILFVSRAAWGTTVIAPITSGTATLVPSPNQLTATESFSLNGPGFSFTGSGLNTTAMNPPERLMLSGAFTATAFFFDPRFQSGTNFIFNGAGILTVNLMLAGPPESQLYKLTGANFVFGSVPEPSTGSPLMVLIASGIGLRLLKRSCRVSAENHLIRQSRRWFRDA